MHEGDLRQLERKAWLSYQQDGLMEIAFGLLLLFAFAGSVADRFHWVAYPLLLLVGPGLALAKRFVTAPRMGSVRFGPARIARKRRVVLVIAVLVAATMLVPLVGGGKEWLHEHPTFMSVALGILVFAAFAAVAYWLQLARMYVVGLLFGGAFTLTEFFETPVPLLVAGALVILSGVVRLVGFVRQYPLPTADDGSR